MSNQPNSKDTNCRKDLEQVRHIEGFPIGEPEGICALSDPPHYTAYPNPHLAEFVGQHGRPYDEETDDYQREPFLSDVSEGKSGSIYMAHTYHTKVPYKAIRPFIEHYTEPNDVVFDGFCGTGMTGVAARSLGRNSILCDLSPAATFIAHNFNTPVDVKSFQQEAKRILGEVKRESAWMYETWHPNCDAPNRVKAEINYIVWSDVFLCPYCEADFSFWDQSVDQENEKVLDSFHCPSCRAELTKDEVEHLVRREHDDALGKGVDRAVQVPVLISYFVGKERFEKRPDASDLAKVEEIGQRELPYWYPKTRIDRDIDIWYERDYRQLGVYSVDSFFTKRNLWCLANLWHKITEGAPTRAKQAVGFGLTGIVGNASKMNRWPRLRGPLSGTLYIPSVFYEQNPILSLERRIRRIKSVFSKTQKFTGNSYLSTQSCTDLSLISSASIDYIFTDPPFGSNIIYSDLSLIWESWFGVYTNTDYEAVIHRRKKEKPGTLESYRTDMMDSFEEMYRILKPSRWITVVFHNTKAAVWNAIQEALSRAGFIVAQVAVLDKKQGSFKQVTAAGAVKNDLVINAYKPSLQFEQQFLHSVGSGQEQSFVAQHLEMLPSTANVERTREMLYSKMLAYYVQHGYEIGMDSVEFYRMLNREFVERDGYWFLDDTQAQEYEQHKVDPSSKEAAEQAQNVLFISDERSAITWLHHFLADGVRSLTDITNAYFKAPRNIDEDQIPELQQLLEETCVQVNGYWKRPDRLTAEELEAKRQERLLRQFDDYMRQARAGQTLEDVRKEAVLAGFTRAYRQKRFQEILVVGRKLDEELVDSSSDIFDFIDIAETKLQV